MDRKNWIYSIILLLVFLIGYCIRNANSTLVEKKIEGYTMGEIKYVVKFVSPEDNNSVLKQNIDSLLKNFNQSLSHYIPTSELSMLNKKKYLKVKNPYFLEVLKESKEIYTETEGAFNPAIAPLINYWGFGPQKKHSYTKENTPTHVIDSLLYLSNFDFVRLDQKTIKKDCTYVQLNFSAIAKGKAVDVILDYVHGLGIQDAYVNIGGECHATGKNGKGITWRVGIAKPLSTADTNAMIAVVQLKDKGMATSGNYRNYSIVDGKRIVHTIDPKTGYPTQHHLLSATIIAPTCMRADAWATACMVLGVEKSKPLLKQYHDIAAYLVYEKEGHLTSYYTDNFKSFLVDEFLVDKSLDSSK